jgi:hypothetical protein
MRRSQFVSVARRAQICLLAATNRPESVILPSLSLVALATKALIPCLTSKMHSIGRRISIISAFQYNSERGPFHPDSNNMQRS